jgi:hypothetical protein
MKKYPFKKVVLKLSFTQMLSENEISEKILIKMFL